MSTIPVYNLAGEPAGEIELAADIFEVKQNPALVHQAVVATLANQRQGTADTKTRAEVHHTTRKMWRQKGTGRARQGMRSAPHWKGGGVVFGPHPRDFSHALPKKMRRQALLCVLSSKAAAEAIMVVDSFPFIVPKTRQAIDALRALGLQEKKIIVVMDEVTPTVALSFRNLPQVLVVSAEGLGTYDALNADCLLFTRAAVERLQTLKREPLGIARWIAKQQQGGDA